MSPAAAHPDLNNQIADKLREMADVLEQQQASSFRVIAYRRAAETLERIDTNVQALLAEGGRDALVALPHIGTGIAAAIDEMVRTGRFTQLERLRGTLDPVHLFSTIPGVGPKLAETIHDHLHVDTLEELEVAAHDGRLERLPGIGPRRAATIRAVLGAQLAHTRRPRRGNHAPSAAALLDADREYRRRAHEGSLETIAPRRFNPEHRAWLPVLHTVREGWHLTALFSNTARAHELDKTHDWVVIYYYDDDHHEGQCTVVTETHGPRAGHRVIRGREAECQEDSDE